MIRPPEQAPGHDALRLVRDVMLIGLIGICLLYFGAGFLIPLALAFLIFVLIIALNNRFAAVGVLGMRLPAWLAMTLGITVVMSGLFAVMYILADQATRFLLTLPNYEERLDEVAARATSLIGDDIATAIRNLVAGLDLSLIAVSAFGGARWFLSTFLLISLYVAFMLAERGMIARKILMATPDPEFGRELGIVMSDISVSVQRYVGVKTFLSLLTSAFCYLVFRALNLQFAETWAVLTFALNFIPAIGSVVAVILPAIVALLQFDTTGPFLVVLLGCGIVQFLIGNFLDPALTGRTLNLSTLMVILSLTFWGSVWGIIGAFLSVPLTVCILIVFSNIDATRPIAILMSKDGTLLRPRSGNRGVDR